VRRVAQLWMQSRGLHLALWAVITAFFVTQMSLGECLIVLKGKQARKRSIYDRVCASDA
jgi:hypothetical protein